MLHAIRMKLRAELEAPREARGFGTGWIAGTLALLAGATGLLLVLVLKHPGWLGVPELSLLRDHALFRPVLWAVVIAAYLLSILSLVLRPEKILGFVGMTVTLAATILGAVPGEPASAATPGGLFLGVDFFVLNVLFMGFLFVPLERFLALRPEQVLFREEWREDIFYYLVSSLFVQVLTFLTLAPSKAVIAVTGDWSAFRASVGALPWLVQVIAIMVLTDFAQYWVHRAFHRVPFLWRFHAVHHSAKSMDWLASARMHFLEIIALRSLTALPMFVLGFSESALQAYLLIVYIYSAFIHANIRGRFGVLEEIFVVPRFHHWHHGIEREAIDVNFAIHFPLLDRLFGTHHMPDNRWPEGYGISGHPVPKGYWAQFLYPFRKG
ncbi:sterol desaturase [Prosthecomicrobium hirschii]|uniref:Sterol desaturase n=1 Tax=Prosthecodimorpha hirschii TaxID=665126 RepID=A0A0P6VGF4_9HYPH|nr:sterol desaturase family protein [Prosthecomicrobium hirschii]KPL51066.1 sterol desaturase [Prosthecomicrobium hirschii]